MYKRQTFGLWRGKELVPGGGDDSAMGQFGCLTTVRDLPPKRQLVALLRKAAALNESGAPRPRTPATKRKPEAKPSAAFAAALAANRKATAGFAAFPPSHRREYVEWIDEARREQTRARRIAQAVEWIAQGKARHWKYENC